MRPERRWHGLHLRLDPEQQDRLIADHLHPLAQAAGKNREWFFLRYRDDTGPHLRTRAWMTSTEAPAVTRLLTAAATRAARGRCPVHEVAYEPETARYGGPDGMRIAHRIFTTDSNSALVLAAADNRPALAALASAHHLMTTLAAPQDLRAEIYQRQCDWVLRTLHAAGGNPSRALSAVEATVTRLATELASAHRWACRQLASAELSDQLAELGRELVAAPLHRPLPAILVDLLHLHFNRVGVTVRQERSAVLLLAAASRRGALP